MVATIPESADQMMWSNLQSKLRIAGRVVDGHLRGSAAGKQPHSSVCLGSVFHADSKRIQSFKATVACWAKPLPHRPQMFWVL